MTLTIAPDSLKFTLFLLAILLRTSLHSVHSSSSSSSSTSSSSSSSSSSSCQYGVVQGNKLYSYNLASALRDFPHGVLSEDGFYKVAANDTVIWFQLCDGMIFNHDPPPCVDCSDCGGPSRCGMGCSALVAKNTGGYYVCTSLGRDFKYDIKLIDEDTPTKGVNVTMSSKSHGGNCSLTVSVACDSNGLKEPESFEKLGTCDYVTLLRHPSGCANTASVHGGGWGWFSTLLTILFCGLGLYLLVGVVYRYYFLRIRGLDVIPNLDFWTSIPHRTKSLFMSLVQRFRGPTYHHRSSYSAVNF